MISKFIKFITENPDTCYWDYDDILNYNSEGARPFGTYKGKVIIGKENNTHFDMGNYTFSRYDLINSGRMWTLEKIISFWDLDQKTTLEIIIKQLNRTIVEDDLDFEINKEWKIEVFNRYDNSEELYNLFD